MTATFNLRAFRWLRRVYIDFHPHKFPAFGIQFGGHGQGGVFVNVWRRVIWVRVV